MEQVRRKHDGDTARGNLAHQIEHLPTTDGVEATRRLVEKHEIRIMNESHRELRALLHSRRELFDRSIASLAKPDEPQDLVRPSERSGSRQAAQLAGERYSFYGAQAPYHDRSLRKIADALSSPMGSTAYRSAQYLDAASRRFQESQKRLEKGGLSGSVRT